MCIVLVHITCHCIYYSLKQAPLTQINFITTHPDTTDKIYTLESFFEAFSFSLLKSAFQPLSSVYNVFTTFGM